MTANFDDGGVFFYFDYIRVGLLLRLFIIPTEASWQEAGSPELQRKALHPLGGLRQRRPQANRLGAGRLAGELPAKSHFSLGIIFNFHHVPFCK